LALPDYPSGEWLSPFLHVAMQMGLSLHLERDAWHIVSGDTDFLSVFPADCPHQKIVTARKRASTPGYSEIPAYSQVLLRQQNSP
jgi:hypothetical protein